MTMKTIFISIILDVVWMGVRGSVVGITYMDDFGFEQRYHRVQECDPFYWHPLHLPEECADMYEKLIRSRLPVRFADRKPKPYRPISSSGYAYEPLYYKYSGSPLYPAAVREEEESDEPESPRELTPYEEMLESVQKDVNNFPSLPLVKDMPNFGPVVVYQQPVSRVSADMIKKVALTYAQSTDERDGKKPTRNRGGKSKRKWKDLVHKVLRQDRKGWRKIDNGNIVTLSKS